MNNELTKRLASQAELFFRRNGPTILTVAGVGGFIVSNVLTARATTKSADKRKEFKLKIDQVKNQEDADQKVRARELGQIVLRDGSSILRDFAPAITVGSVSIVCVVAAHGIMQKRQASLIAAYAALDRGFKAYRARVQEELGIEKERELYMRPELLPCEEDNPDAEKSVDYGAPLPSPYARFFDALNPNWTKTGEYNLFFLRSQQNWANDRLKAKGHIFLNEVYDSLGLPRSQAGQIVGWTTYGDGDGFVDFGLFDIKDEVSRAFVNGLEDTILLDFNVDGPIVIR